MNLGIAGAEDGQSQGSLSFQCSIFEISLVARFAVLKFSAPFMAHFDEHNSLLCRFF